MPVDLSASIYSQYLRVYKLALEAEKKGKTKEASAAYHQAAEFMRSYAKYAIDATVKQKREDKAASLDKISQTLIKIPEGGNLRKTSAVNMRSEGRESSSKDSGDSEFDEQIKQLITRTRITWDDVAGMEYTKAAIKTAYFEALAKNLPGWRSAVRVVFCFTVPLERERLT